MICFCFDRVIRNFWVQMVRMLLMLEWIKLEKFLWPNRAHCLISRIASPKYLPIFHSRQKIQFDLQGSALYTSIIVFRPINIWCNERFLKIKPDFFEEISEILSSKIWKELQQRVLDNFWSAYISGLIDCKYSCILGPAATTTFLVYFSHKDC